MRLSAINGVPRLLREDDSLDFYNFKYANFKLDPSPRVIVLGSYRFPTTGNTVVGGVNINYMTQKELEELAKVLPTILKANGLRNRYRVGLRLAPYQFKNFYRTYSQEYVKSIEPIDLSGKRTQIRKDKIAQSQKQTTKKPSSPEIQQQTDETPEQEETINN